MATTPIRNHESDRAGNAAGTPDMPSVRPIDERRLAEDSRELERLCRDVPEQPASTGTSGTAAGTTTGTAAEQGGGLSDLFREARGRLSDSHSPAAKEREGKRSREAEEKGAADKQPRPEATPGMERGTAAARLVPAAANAATPTDGVEQSITLDRYEQLVDRILVSVPRADGSQEIRLRLDAQWLPNAEVRLTSAGGEVGVEFILDAAAKGFIEPRLPMLRERLRERLGRSVAVGISARAEEDPRSERETRPGRR